MPSRPAIPLLFLFNNGFAFQFLFFFLRTDLAQILGPVQAIQEQDAIQVIDLVLENTAEPAFGAHADGFPAHVLSFDDNALSPANIVAIIARNAQTPLGTSYFSLRLDDFRIHHSQPAVFIFRYKYANREINLRGR